MKLLLLFFLTCVGAVAQLQTGVQYQFTDPAPACSPRAILVSNNLAGKLWQCKNGTYTDITGGGGGGGGTVTSVGFSTNLGTVTGSPVTTSGTLTNTVTGAQVVSLFTGCSGTQYLGADGACHNASGTNYWTLTGSDIYNNNAGNVGIGGAPGNYLLDVVKSASTGTAQFYDQTATTGSTLINIRNGAGQGGQVVQFRDNSNNIMSYILSDGAFGNTDVPGNRKTSVAPDGFGLADDVNLRWQNSINWGAGSVDTGVGRNAAGVVELNNGTLGTYRDLIARDVTVNSQAGGGTQCAQFDNAGKISGTGGACGGGSGTVTSIATTSPITGGTITTTGTIACATCVTSAASLTSNLPVFGSGGQATAVGTRSGNTTEVATVTGSLVSGNCLKADASGNVVDSGLVCNNTGAAALSISGWYTTDGTNYYSGPHNAPMTLPSAGSFTWVNQGSATETANGNALTLFGPHATPDSIHLREMSIGTNTTLTASLACTSKAISFNSCLIGFRESSSGKLEEISYQFSTGKIAVNKWNSPTSFNSTPFTGTVASAMPTWLSFRLIYTTGSPGTITLQQSMDDSSWEIMFTENSNTFFSGSGGPDQWFYGVNANNATANADIQATLYSWKVQ